MIDRGVKDDGDPGPTAARPKQGLNDKETGDRDRLT